MRRIVVLAALLVARTASANQCIALQHFIVTPEVPLGCPVVVYQDHEWHSGQVPVLWVDRAGTRTDLTPASVTNEAETLPIYFDTIDENCVEFHGYLDRVWDRMTVDVGAAVQVGDVVNVDSGFSTATITAAGPCPTPAPPDYLSCADPYQDFEACDMRDMPGDVVDEPEDTGYFGGGCNAGGELGLAGIALLVGLRRRRVTSRPRS
ncbi:MAG TPA: hypothetical protein VIV40_03095 [Kofleriaceae bacterium]